MTGYAAANAEAAADICRFFGQALDVDSVAPEDDFFDLGGTSLKGVELIARIERRFGTRLKLADLYETPTAAALAARLEASRPDSPVRISSVSLPAVLPAIEAQRHAEPVVLVHVVPDDLVKQIRRRRPVTVLSYGLIAGDHNSGWPPPVGIEALAKHYVIELQAIRPVGPYHLVGASLGGLIAWEMAHQLRAGGAEVGILGVIDTRPRPGQTHRSVGLRRAVMNLASVVASTPARDVARGVVDFLHNRLLTIRARLTRATSAQQRRWQHADLRARHRMIDAQPDAYRMPPWPWPLLLIEATGIRSLRFWSERIALSEVYDLAGLTPGGQIHVEIPGDHVGVVTAPLAQRVAVAIENAIQAAERKPPECDSQ